MEQVALQNNQIIAPLARPEGVARGKWRELDDKSVVRAGRDGITERRAEAS